MAFTSYTFAGFLLAVFLGYFLLPKKVQWIWLLICSYVFYACSGWYYLVFLIYSTAVTFLTGLALGRTAEQSARRLDQCGADWTPAQKKEHRRKTSRKKKLILILGLVFNFAVLAVFKYFLGPVNTLLTRIYDLFCPGHVINLLFPLGISFYTFQSAGYVIDCYWENIHPDRSFFRYALFVSFFPQLIQGPISRHSSLAGQLYAPHNFDYTRCKHGLELMLWGYFKKVVIADRTAILVSTVIDNFQSYSGCIIFAAILFYALQLYADFSGGIDVARGAAQVLGIELAENFRRPFFSQSLNEFWQRWHITLGAWFRDYVFYPLAVSRQLSRLAKRLKKHSKYLGKVLPNVLASFVSFVILGIWHGSQWKYVAFGLYTGGIIALSTLLDPCFSRLNDRLHINTSAFSWRLFRMLRTLFFVTIGLYFIRGAGFISALAMLKRTFLQPGFIYLWNNTLVNIGLNWPNMVLVLTGLLLMITVGILQERGLSIRQTLDGQNLWFEWAVLLLGVFAVLIFGIYGTGYNAASFIYETF